MTRYLIMCRSLTHAQRSARLLERYAITSTVVKADVKLSTSGCRYAVDLARHFDDAIRILKNNDMLKGKVYQRIDDEAYKEIMV